MKKPNEIVKAIRAKRNPDVMEQHEYDCTCDQCMSHGIMEGSEDFLSEDMPESIDLAEEAKLTYPDPDGKELNSPTDRIDSLMRKLRQSRMGRK